MLVNSQYQRVAAKDSKSHPITDDVPPSTASFTDWNDQRMPLRTQRQWKHPWYSCFGDCSAPDVMSFVLALKSPFLLWSWNQSRALQLSFWREFGRLLLIILAIYATFVFVLLVAKAVVCSPESPPSPDGHLSKQCATNEAWVLLLVAFLISIAASLCFAYRRTAMRQHLGITGSFQEDALLYHFCMPCALAQETRTLMHHNVQAGVWHGPLPGAQGTAPSRPREQQMV